MPILKHDADITSTISKQLLSLSHSFNRIDDAIRDRDRRLLRAHQRRRGRSEGRISGSRLKRAVDVVVAATLLAILTPFLLFIMLAIKLDSPGPAMFFQRRRGLDDAEFYICKFRTMKVMEDGPVVSQAQQDDPRVTRMGRILRKLNIDELPQLFNVLKGEMSLVGPRPHAVAHDEMYRNLIEDYALRLRVFPGITGWAQINGLRGETRDVRDMKERVRMDLWYIECWSIWLDLFILLQTPLKAFHKKAY